MRAALTLGLALCTSSAVAQELSVYVGGGIGELDHENETGGAFSDTVSSWKVYGGFQVGDHFSMEASHGETSTIEVRAPGGSLSVGNRLLQDAHSVDFELTTIRVMGRLPLDHIDLWMSVGSFRLEADVVMASGGVPSSLSVEATSEDIDSLVGVGVDWKLGALDQPIRVRLEYERLDFQYSRASTVAVGVAYRFGDL